MKQRYLLAGGAVILVVAAVFIALFMLGSGTTQNRKSTPPAATGTMKDMPGMSVENAPKPAAEKTAQEAPTVEFPEDMQKLIGVKTTAAALKEMTKTVRLTERIGYDEKNISTVNTKVDGWVEKLYVDYEGRYLKKGEPVIDIYSPELFAAQQELISLISSNQAGEGRRSPHGRLGLERLRDAARKRFNLFWDISDAQIGRVERMRKPMMTLTIASPASGYVVKRYASRGVKVMSGEPLLDIVNLSIYGSWPR